jgi:hypothetical protein
VEKTLTVLNNLEKKGLIKRYAIGGGIAVLFYAEPILTYDLDVFCLLPKKGGKLITLSPIYEHLQGKGYKTDGEHIIIEDLPVQFIPAYNKLVEEALDNAVEIKYKKVKTKMISLEFLLAIMLQTFRPKDRERIVMLLDEAIMDQSILENILKRHRLMKKWHEFRRRYDGK